MQVSVESPGGLQRRLKVQVPATRLEEAVQQRLQQWGRKAKLAGFRPGKVPLKVLQQHFGDQARQEAMGDIVQATYVEALQQVALNPAGAPQIEFAPLTLGQDLQYTATFDVYPEIQLKGLDALEVKKPVAEVGEDDIDRTLQSMREQRRRFEPVTRPAASGDQVMIDFEGTVDGQAFGGNKGDNVPVEIGSGRFLEQMEQGLVGRSAGEACEITVDFPADYPAEELKGKQALFKVQLRQVAEPRLPELDEAFVKAAGVHEGGVEALRGKIRDSLARERDKAVAGRVKQQVFDAVLAANPLELPRGLVAQEVGRMRQEALQRLPQQIRKQVEEDPKRAQGLFPEDVFLEGAQRRVALGLLIAEIIRQRSLALDPARVEQRVQELAADYERADEVIRFYRGNREIMQGIEAMVMEEQVVESLLAGARVTEVPSGLQALMRPAHGEPGHVHGPDCDH